jgi:hypothetical protein
MSGVDYIGFLRLEKLRLPVAALCFDLGLAT